MQKNNFGNTIKGGGKLHADKTPSSNLLFLCKYLCQEQVAKIEELTKHYSLVHEEKKPLNDQAKKIVLCKSLCLEKFAKIEELAKHYSLVHEEKKPINDQAKYLCLVQFIAYIEELTEHYFSVHEGNIQLKINSTGRQADGQHYHSDTVGTLQIIDNEEDTHKDSDIVSY